MVKGLGSFYPRFLSEKVETYNFESVQWQGANVFFLLCNQLNLTSLKLQLIKTLIFCSTQQNIRHNMIEIR